MMQMSHGLFGYLTKSVALSHVRQVELCWACCRVMEVRSLEIRFEQSVHRFVCKFGAGHGVGQVQKTRARSMMSWIRSGVRDGNSLVSGGVMGMRHA